MIIQKKNKKKKKYNAEEKKFRARTYVPLLNFAFVCEVKIFSLLTFTDS